jgi:hypothetical protein
MEKEKVEIKWLRKRPFWGEMRKFLKGFRVIEVRTEVGDERGAPPMLQRQSGAYVPTGRRVIRLTLIGYQRPPRKAVLQSAEGVAVNDGVQVPPREKDPRIEKKGKKK